MSATGWTALLQWSRMGLSALVFLAAARVLSLADIGFFAMLFAPVRLLQNALRVGFSEAVILHPDRPRRLAALMSLSLAAGLVLSACVLLGAVLSDLPLLALMSPLPLLAAAGAIPEGRLRKAFRLRTLALRTLTAQSLAALVAGIALWRGAGPEALAVFALVATAATSALAVLSTPLRPLWPARAMLRPLLRQPLQIAARDALGSGVFPLAQLCFGAFFGLAAAGAFQMAVRLLHLTEALTLAPLRFQAMPILRSTPDALSATLHRAAMVAFWAWPGLYVAAPEIAHVALGPGAAPAVTPLLRALAPLGLLGALSMPLAQGLAARGATHVLILRMLVMLALTGAALWLCRDATPQIATMALSLSSALAALLLLWMASRVLALHRVALPIAPALSGLAMTGGLLSFDLALPAGIALVLQIALGSAIYLAGLALFTARSRNVTP
ncbi:oligosaccharide flippase family protein [Roseivivax sp. CAU 1753]